MSKNCTHGLWMPPIKMLWSWTLLSVLRGLLWDNLESYQNNFYLVSSFLYFLNTSIMKYDERKHRPKNDVQSMTLMIFFCGTSDIFVLTASSKSRQIMKTPLINFWAGGIIYTNWSNTMIWVIDLSYKNTVNTFDL